MMLQQVFTMISQLFNIILIWNISSKESNLLETSHVTGRDPLASHFGINLMKAEPKKINSELLR